MFFFIFKMIFVNNYLSFFFFNDTATTEIYTLSLHDALPIFEQTQAVNPDDYVTVILPEFLPARWWHHLLQDRKSTRLNSSHSQISYAVFCLKKKKKFSLDPLFSPPFLRLPFILYHLYSLISS